MGGEMGTEITLDVGGLNLTYSKNHIGVDNGCLFQESDRKRIKSSLIDYDYFEESGEDPASMEMGFSQKLRYILPRLELLGFTMPRVQRYYEAAAEQWRLDNDYDHIDEDEEDTSPPAPMNFEEFKQYVTQHAISALDDTYVEGFDEDSMKRVVGRFDDHELNRRLPHYDIYDKQGYSERSHFGEIIGIIHPYALLRLLAENPANLDEDVVWQYGRLVDAGWAQTSEFVPCARRRQTFLIATEGSSDVHILKHALAKLRPEVADFFRFIDVSERHPFSGTGNLLKFAEGLAKIDVHNQVLFIFDNDAEGADTHAKLTKLILPPNMRGIILPELEAFNSFPASGPQGVADANINRRAAAIECYLDLRRDDYPPAKIIWTNLKTEPDIYQGALEYKDSYTKIFLHQTADELAAGAYDTSKIMAVLDAIIAECSEIAATETQYMVRH